MTIETIAVEMTGALAPRRTNGRAATNDDNRRHAREAATIVLRHGWGSLSAVVRADRERRPGCRELSDIINAGYPLSDLDAFLVDLGAP